ncbi:MAG: metallophosphoesterase family protein [Chloroflexi bacterium]|nr:metallophosphoesterase family protein [Chloroflexota bacterium]
MNNPDFHFIGVMSDTHNNRDNTLAALEIFRQRSISTIFHCGDLGQPDLLDLFTGFELYLAIGNTDQHPEELRRRAKQINPHNQVDYHLQIHLSGKSIWVVHDLFLQDVSGNPSPDFIFHGHTHRPAIKRLSSQTTLINPGTTGGAARAGMHSICLLELVYGSATFLSIPGNQPFAL